MLYGLLSGKTPFAEERFFGRRDMDWYCPCQEIPSDAFYYHDDRLLTTFLDVVASFERNASKQSDHKSLLSPFLVWKS